MSNYTDSTDGATEALDYAADTAKSDIIDPTREAVEQVVRRGEEFARRQGEQLEEFVIRKPLVAVGAAFGLGVLATIIVRLKFN